MPDNHPPTHPPTFTVFTPTYNRAHTLDRPYQSLRQQTCRDFEWLILDDGSTDGTAELVARWQGEADFPIRYLFQENQGKHVAMNRGLAEAAGEFFVILDSDDACVPAALERFQYHWNALSSEEKQTVSYISCLCLDQNGQPVGEPFPDGLRITSYLDLRFRWRRRGEHWACHRTDVLRQFPFPEDLRRVCFPEGIIWARLSRRYQTRCINEALRIYHISPKSLVHGQRPEESAPGGRLMHAAWLNEHIDYFRYDPLEFFRSAVHYARWSFLLGMPLRRQRADLTNPLARWLWAAALPLAWLVFLRDCWRGRQNAAFLDDSGNR